METKQEVQEVQILSEDQILALPKEVKENVVFLTEVMNAKDLIVLNPIVVELLNIKKAVEDIELIPIGEDGKFNAENIKIYKSIKASVGTFNTGLTSAAKELKAPHIEISKSLVAIEKSIKGVSKSLKEEVMTKFKVYEDDVIAKAKIASDKKNKLLIDAKELADAENLKLRIKNKRSEVYNEVKYVRIAEGITGVVSKAIIESNETHLLDRKEIIQMTTFKTMTQHLDMDLIDEVLLADLTKSFNEAHSNALKLIDVKLADFATKRENIILEAKSTVTPIEKIEVAAETVDNGISDIPSPPGTKNVVEPYKGPDLTSLNDAEFCGYIKGAVELLERMVEDRVNSEGVSCPHIYKLKGFLNSITPNL